VKYYGMDLSLLNRDTDTNRRLAMISIDNVVELMIVPLLLPLAPEVIVIHDALPEPVQ
jgi:hypothetical protein